MNLGKWNFLMCDLGLQCFMAWIDLEKGRSQLLALVLLDIFSMYLVISQHLDVVFSEEKKLSATEISGHTWTRVYRIFKSSRLKIKKIDRTFGYQINFNKVFQSWYAATVWWEGFEWNCKCFDWGLQRVRGYQSFRIYFSWNTRLKAIKSIS